MARRRTSTGGGGGQSGKGGRRGMRSSDLPPVSVRYLVKPGARITKEAAEECGPIIDRLIEKKRGTPDELVRLAKNKRSAAHKYFQWNDPAAAHEHRLSQARELFRGIAIVMDEIDSRPVRRYHVIRYGDGSQRYEKITDIRNDEDMTHQIVARARRELIDWHRRYQYLRRMAELDGVFTEIETLLKQGADNLH